jgi:hypothetical protein
MGQAWVDLYKQASDLRKKASDLSIRIEGIQAQISLLRVDLAIAQDDQRFAEAGIEGVTTQATGAEQNFTQVRQSANTQDKVIRNVYENAAIQPAGGTSLKDQIDALVDQAQKVQTTWDAAAKLLSDSAEHFTAAQSAAESLQMRLNERAVEIPGDVPEKAAWDQLKRVYDPTNFRFSAGVSLQTLGTLYADELASLKQLADVKNLAMTTLAQANLAVPASLDSAHFDSLINQASDAGQQAFAKADNLFEDASNAPLATAEQKNAARVARALELYAWYQLDQLTGSDQAAAHLSAAHDAVKEAVANNATLPILPSQIEPVAAAPTTAPARQ